jgi:plastocyanin
VRFGASVVAALVVVAGVACDRTTAGEDLHGKPVTLGDNYFNPVTLTINPGDTVVWVWNGSVHNVTFDQTETGAPSDCGQFSLGECRRIFTIVGTYPFVCTLHSGMQGEVIVEAVH